MDSQNRLWFGENTGNRIGMFDTNTKEMREWLIPTPWSDSYDAVRDKSGKVWAGGRMTDHWATALGIESFGHLAIEPLSHCLISDAPVTR